jgi:exodeoxyribonuclease VII large subunit
VVPDVVEERRKVHQLRDQAVFRVGSYLEAELQKLASIRSRPMLASPFGFIDQLSATLAQHVQMLNQLQLARLQQASATLTGLRDQVRALSPEQTMRRGYSVVTDAAGAPIGAKIKTGDEILVQSFEFRIQAQVEKVEKK